MASELQYVSANGGYTKVDAANGLPVSIAPGQSFVSKDLLWKWTSEGRIFVAADADQNDFVTGQTSFANTTPTFMLRAPVDRIVVPLFLNLSQTGSVAGAAIDVLIEVDGANRYSTGGTAETTYCTNTAVNTKARATLLSNPTALAGYGVRVWGATIGQDISPAEGAVQGPFWKPEVPYFIGPRGSLLIYTYAGTTGPTWAWSVGWAELPLDYAL